MDNLQVNNAGVNGLMVEGDVSILPEMIEREAFRGVSDTTEVTIFFLNYIF